MKFGALAARASFLSLGLALAACGGGGSGGGVASTPTPAPVYQTLDQLVASGGDRSFTTGGVQYEPGYRGQSLTNGVAQLYGSGVQVDYEAATGNYTLTEPGSAVVTFNDPGDVTSYDPDGLVRFDNQSGYFLLVIPEVDGVSLSYTLLGIWQNFGKIRLAAGGIPTLQSDVPVSGTASYSLSVGGSVTAAKSGGGGASLAGSGASGTFTANFGNGTVATTLDLSGTETATNKQFDFGILSGAGTIDSGGPGFSGTLSHGETDSGTGVFSGAFFGPQAVELGYGWFFEGDDFDAAGMNAGKKD